MPKRKMCLAFVMCAVILAVASPPDARCYPAAGFDYFDSTTARITLQIFGPFGFNDTINLQGPANITRSSPYDPGDGHLKINTTITLLHLTGNSMYIGLVTILESPSKDSNGTVHQQTAWSDYPADSAFWVFVEIQTIFGTFHNDDPVFMGTTIYAIPPWGANYTSVPEPPVYLKNETGYVVGRIIHVWHKLPEHPVGGSAFLVDWIRVAAPFIGLAATITIASVAAAVCVKRVGRRKEKP